VTTILTGVRCHDCKATVSVVRRKVAYWCSGHGRVCNSVGLAPTLVEADGTAHLCPQPPERGR
jgi:hypothetical protein